MDTIVYEERPCQERPRQVPGIENAVQVSVGNHECALLVDERVVCWGWHDGWGGLGRGQTDSPDPEVPAPVVGLSGIGRVAVGREFSCALSTAGEVSCWGSNSQGTLGRGLDSNALYSDPTPGLVVGLGPVAELEVHGDIACAVTEAGEVYCWGETNYLFQEADKPDKTSGIELAPVAISYVSDAVQVSTQGFVACALQTSNEVVCWGLSGAGATGNGRFESGEDYSGLPVVWDP